MDEFTTLRQVRQVAQFPLLTSLDGGELALLQRGGLGGPYGSISAADLVGWGLASGGTLRLSAGEAISWNGTLAAPVTLRAGPLGFSLSAPVSVSGNLDAVGLSVAGQPVATHNWVQSSFDYLLAHSVSSWNGRTGAVVLSTDDILRAGGAPADNPVFSGRVVGPTHWNPALCDDTLVTSAWVQQALCAGLWTFAASPYFYGSPTAATPPAGDYSKRIANTIWVIDELDQLRWQIDQDIGAVNLVGYAPLDSPQFTGVPTAPTAAQTVSSGQLATTAFVHAAVTAATAGVASFNGRTGAVTLTTADITSAGGAPIAAPAFTGFPTAQTPAPGVNNTQLATTAYVTTAIGASVTSFNTRTGAVTLTSADVTGAGGALLASPVFTGVPAAPTAAPGTSTTQLATTAFVAAAVGAGGGVASFNGRTGAVVFQASDISAVGGALLASPAFTGAPTAPTQAPGTSNTDIATTAFVAAAVIAGASGVASFNTRTGAVTLSAADVTGTNVLWWKNIKTDFGAVGDGVTDDSAAFLAFQTWAQAQTHGVVLVIPPGTYSITPLTLGSTWTGAANFYAGISDLTILAYGATVANFYRQDPFGFVNGITSYTARIASTAVGDTTATLLNSADASKFNVNDWVAVTSIEMQGADKGYPPNWYNFDYTQIKTISGTTVTFTTPLLRTHLSTFPVSGLGTLAPNYDWGGPATIVRIDPTWNQVVRVFGMTVSGKTNCCARKMAMIDCNFAANTGSASQTCTCSSGMEFVFDRCNVGSGALELDKNIGIMKFVDSTLDTLSVQSASVEMLVLDGCKVLTKLNGYAKNTSLKDSHIQNITLGPAIGLAKTLLLDDCRVGSVTWSDAQHFINLSELTFSNGTFSAPIGTQAFIDVQRIAIPGTIMYIASPGHLTGNLGNPFIVTSAYQDSSNIYFDTTLTAIPVYVLGAYTGVQPTAIAVHPALSVYARGCTGCIDVAMWSRQPAGKPSYTEAHRIYSANLTATAVGQFTNRPQVWCQGALVSLTINVIRAYTGPAATMTMTHCGTYGAFATQMATNTMSQYNAKINLKIAGVRTITPSAVTGNQTGDVITAPVAGNIWFWQDALDPLLSTAFTTETPTQLPIVQIDLVTDQGVTALVYDPVAHT